MSCAKHKNAMNAAFAPAEDDPGFYADLADGLHAMAQPLTIVRSAIAMLGRAGAGGPDQQRYLELATRQIDRTCATFVTLQNLVALKLEPANPGAIDLRALLTRMIEDRRAAFRENGIEITATAPELLPSVLADADRTEQALAAVLDTAAAVCLHGDSLAIRTSQTDELVVVQVAGERGPHGDMSAARRLSLSLAKASVLSQCGRYRMVEEPFCITFALPACTAVRHASEAFSEAYAS